MEKLEMETGEGEKLSFDSAIPNEIVSQILPPVDQSVFSLYGQGSYLTQKIQIENLAIWHISHTIFKDTILHCTRSESFLYLHMVLKSSAHLETKGLKTADILEGQFNITFLPYVDVKSVYKPGKQVSVLIPYSVEHLSKFVQEFQGLEKFLSNVENNIASRLAPRHIFASAEMIRVVNEILYARFTKPLNTLYIETKSLELLFLAIRKLTNEKGNKIITKQADIQKIHSAKEWLMENIDDPGTLAQLASRVHTNEFKLKSIFKEVYGTTVFDFLLNARMENAKKLLLETELPIADIGYLAGYSSPATFTSAFRKHFGYAPKFVRKK